METKRKQTRKVEKSVTSDKINTYYKIKVAFRPAKNRFYRVFLVRKGVWLETFCENCLLCLGADMDHLYQLLSNVPIPTRAKVDDLPFDSMLIYDFGDNWQFKITKYKAERQLPVSEKRKMYLIDGKGQSMWEDFIWAFYRYLSGSLTDENWLSDYDEECPPFPYGYEKPSDFDLPLDIELANKEYFDA